MSEPKKRIHTADERDFQEIAIRRNHWDLEVDVDVELSDLARTDFWCHIAYKLRPWDRIDVRHCTGSWMAEIVVRSVGPQWASVALLRQVKFPDAVIPDEILASPYRIEYVRGSSWRIIRKADSRLIQGEFRTAAEAVLYVKLNLLAESAA